MSKYTTEVRFICETGAGLTDSEGFNSIDDIMEACVDNVFNFDFPIFDENYRKVLEIKILKHYYTREICAETVGLWKHFLANRLNEIMPYYNKLYQSELLAFNPLYDVDISTSHQGQGSSNSEGELSNTRTDNLTRNVGDSGTESRSGSDSNSVTNWDVYSDTPQGALTNVNNETYLTNARKVTNSETGQNSQTTTFGKQTAIRDSGTQTNVNITSDNVTTTDAYLNRVSGKTGGVSYSKLLKEYRETFMNIDMLIIEDLSDLFFNLW